VKVCVVTCTGGRPELFALCRRWVERQTHKPDAWIVTTDCSDAPDIPAWATLLRVPPEPKDEMVGPVETAMWALTCALANVPPDHAVVIMEDDDWYSATHVATAVEQLCKHSIAQLGELWRFHLPASRAAKGVPASPDQRQFVPGVASFRHSEIPTICRVIRTPSPWYAGIHFYDADTCVSIKGVGFGLPGRCGATRKHIPDHRKTLRARPDPGHRMFRKKVGPDAASYLSLLQHGPQATA